MNHPQTNPLQQGRVASVNVGQIRDIEWLGRTWQTAIWKSPVAGPIAVRGVNLDGDDQADRTVHGGEDKAVYAYASEDAAWWASKLGRSVEPGSFGENLTIEGIDATSAVIGEQWQIGNVILAVSQPRVPCFKLGARMNDPAFPQAFAAAGKPGVYFRILQEGQITQGDTVSVSHRPEHGLTVGDVAAIYHEHRSVDRLLDAPELAEGWRAWALKVQQARSRKSMSG